METIDQPKKIHPLIPVALIMGLIATVIVGYLYISLNKSVDTSSDGELSEEVLRSLTATSESTLSEEETAAVIASSTSSVSASTLSEEEMAEVLKTLQATE